MLSVFLCIAVGCSMLKRDVLFVVTGGDVLQGGVLARLHGPVEQLTEADWGVGPAIKWCLVMGEG